MASVKTAVRADVTADVTKATKRLVGAWDLAAAVAAPRLAARSHLLSCLADLGSDGWPGCELIDDWTTARSMARWEMFGGMDVMRRMLMQPDTRMAITSG